MARCDWEPRPVVVDSDWVSTCFREKRTLSCKEYTYQIPSSTQSSARSQTNHGRTNSIPTRTAASTRVRVKRTDNFGAHSLWKDMVATSGVTGQVDPVMLVPGVQPSHETPRRSTRTKIQNMTMSRQRSMFSSVDSVTSTRSGEQEHKR